MEQYLLAVYDWVIKAKALNPDVCSWIGVYFKESYLHNLESTDLVLGPFIGEPTEHTRIPIDRGMCGLALREERIVNLDDVHSDTRHIACSLKTKSELVIPIQNQSGQYVAELDIDSNRLASFSKEIEDKFKKHCLSFPFKEDYIPLNPKLTIESDRLILRPILESDLPAIFDYAKREDVAKFVTFNAHETLEDTKKFFQYAKKEYANGFMEPLGITLKENPHLVIGTIGLKTKSSKHFSAEFGYALHPNFWGQNIMSEALKTFIDYAFTHLPYNRLQAHCMDENLASGRVMEKAGMKYEGTYREVMFVKEKMRTLKCYAILKREWKK